MKRPLFILLMAALILAACQTATVSPTPGVDVAQQKTAAALTDARATSAFLETQLAITPTTAATETPQNTSTPRPTATTAPTVTPLATDTPENTPTPPVPCNAVDFVSDVTIPDNTVLQPGAGFVKTWQLKNVGSCTWNRGYSVVWITGHSMGTTLKFPLTTNIAPGQTGNISISLIAPLDTGNWIGWWKLQDASGNQFGTGDNHDKAFWVRINVGTTGLLTDPHMANVYCSAVWKSSTTTIPCPSPSVDYVDGMVTFTSTPVLEGGYQDNQPTIIVVPSNGTGGYIAGTFPAFHGHTGQHFVTRVGCTNNVPKCSVTFRLKYKLEGGTDETSIGNWDESYDGSTTAVDVDLSFADGKSIQLILVVENKNGSSQDDVVFWLDPQIVTK